MLLTNINELNSNNNKKQNDEIPLLKKKNPIISYKELILDDIKLGIAIGSSFCVEIASQTISQYYLSLIGEDEFAAGTLINISKLLQIGMTAPMYIIYALVGQELGKFYATKYKTQKEQVRRNITRYIQQGWYYGILATVPVALLFAFSNPVFVNLLAQPKQSSTIAQTFLRTYLPGLVAFMYNVTAQAFLNTTGSKKHVLIINVISLLISALVGALLSQGYLNFPNLGVKGVAIGMATRNWVNTIFYTLVMLCRHRPETHNRKIFALSCTNNYQYMKEFLTLGFPLFVKMNAEVLTNFSIGILYGLKGTDAQISFNIIIQFLNLVDLPMQSFGYAASSLVGMYEGKKDKVNSFRQGNAIFLINFTFALISLVLAYTLSEPISRFFAHNYPNIDHISAMTKTLLTITAIGQLIDSQHIAATNALQGKLDVTRPTIYALLGLLMIGVFMAYLLSDHTSLDTNGIPIGASIGITVTMLLTVYRWFDMTQEQWTQSNSKISRCASIFFRSPNNENNNDSDKSIALALGQTTYMNDDAQSIDDAITTESGNYSPL